MTQKVIKLIVQILIIFQCFNSTNASDKWAPTHASKDYAETKDLLDKPNHNYGVFACIITGQIILILFSIFYCCWGCYTNKNNEEEKQQPPINPTLSPQPLQAGPLISHPHRNYNKKHLLSPTNNNINNNNTNFQNNNASKRIHYPEEADFKLEAKKNRGCCCKLLKFFLLCCKRKKETPSPNIADSHDMNAELNTPITIVSPKAKKSYDSPNHQKSNRKKFEIGDCIKIKKEFTSPKGYRFYEDETYEVYAKSKDSILFKTGHAPNHTILEIKQSKYKYIMKVPKKILTTTNQSPPTEKANEITKITLLSPPRKKVNEINTEEFNDFFQSVRQSKNTNFFLSSHDSINLIQRNSNQAIDELYSAPKLASLGPDIEISDTSSSNFL